MNVLKEKYRGVWAYLLFIVGPLVVLYGFKDNSRLTKIHAAQALLIHISVIIASILIFVPIVGCIAMLYPVISSILMIIGAIKAASEEEFVVPGLTNWAMSMFKSVIDNESNIENKTENKTAENSAENNTENNTENSTESSNENNDENK